MGPISVGKKDMRLDMRFELINSSSVLQVTTGLPTVAVEISAFFCIYVIVHHNVIHKHRSLRTGCNRYKKQHCFFSSAECVTAESVCWFLSVELAPHVCAAKIFILSNITV